MNHRTLLLLMLTGCGPCRSCDPDLPDTSEDTDTSDVDTNPPVDTSEPPACDLPESEPNNAFEQAEALPLEVQACGDIDPAFDSDNWRFAVPAEQWMTVYLYSTSLGSLHDAALVLIDEDEVSVEARERDSGESDVELTFLAPAGTYTALVIDENLQGGPDDYFYELLVAEAKAPVTHTVVEDDADFAADAMTLMDEDTVLGYFADLGDEDWYRVPIPAGTASVEITVEALRHGSPSDIRLELFEGPDQRFIGTILSDADGTSGDPANELPTDGDTDWYIKVVERRGRGGYAFWYAMTVDLKGAL